MEIKCLGSFIQYCDCCFKSSFLVGLGIFLFVWFDSLCKLRPSQQFFSHVRIGLPGSNQYKAADKVSWSRTKHCDSTSGEARTSNSNTPPTEPLHSVTFLVIGSLTLKAPITAKVVCFLVC